MNSTMMTTILGLVQAIGAATLDYLMHNPMEGGAMKQPTFWIGLVIAAAMGLKGYYTQGVHQPAPTPAPQTEAPKA